MGPTKFRATELWVLLLNRSRSVLVLPRCEITVGRVVHCTVTIGKTVSPVPAALRSGPSFSFPKDDSVLRLLNIVASLVNDLNMGFLAVFSGSPAWESSVRSAMSIATWPEYTQAP
jgi:hypothetical protein